jgi:hypothetical protein
MAELSPTRAPLRRASDAQPNDGFPPQLGKSRQVLRMDTAKARAADKLHALEAGGRVARAEKGFNTRPLQGYHQNTHGR